MCQAQRVPVEDGKVLARLETHEKDVQANGKAPVTSNIWRDWFD
jgi:hypothetical protein